MSAGVSDWAVESHEISEAKYGLAATRVQQVEMNLRPQLLRAVADAQMLRDMNQYTNDTLEIISM